MRDEQRLDCFVALLLAMTENTIVIPGCAAWRRPGIHPHDGGYGFGFALRAPRN